MMGYWIAGVLAVLVLGCLISLGVGIFTGSLVSFIVALVFSGLLVGFVNVMTYQG